MSCASQKPPLRPLAAQPRRDPRAATTSRPGSRSLAISAVHRPVKPPPTTARSASVSPYERGRRLGRVRVVEPERSRRRRPRQRGRRSFSTARGPAGARAAAPAAGLGGRPRAPSFQRTSPSLRAGHVVASSPRRRARRRRRAWPGSPASRSISRASISASAPMSFSGRRCSVARPSRADDDVLLHVARARRSPRSTSGRRASRRSRPAWRARPVRGRWPGRAGAPHTWISRRALGGLAQEARGGHHAGQRRRRPRGSAPIVSTDARAGPDGQALERERGVAQLGQRSRPKRLGRGPRAGGRARAAAPAPRTRASAAQRPPSTAVDTSTDRPE